MRNRLSITLIAWCVTGTAMASSAVEITSPNGDLVATFAVRDFGDAKDCPCYRVDFKGRPVIVESRLGLDLDSGTLSEGLTLAGQTAAGTIPRGNRSAGSGPRFAIATMRSSWN